MKIKQPPPVLRNLDNPPASAFFVRHERVTPFTS